MQPIYFPSSLVEAVRYFSDPENCHRFMVMLRWPNGITCPTCNSQHVGKLVVIEKDRKGQPLKVPRRIWNCKNKSCDKRQFSVKVGTIFEDSALGLDKWLTAVWMIVNAKNGISSCELSRNLDITQKTAWFMLHRVRLALHEGTIEKKLRGRVEADETYIGARARNMHKHKRHHVGHAGVEKTSVLGVLERSAGGKPSRVSVHVTKTNRKHELQKIVRDIVEKNSEIYTDSLRSYEGLSSDYAHQVIDHLQAYARGRVHTNGLENFWSLLKRALKGTYVSVEPFHLFRYCDEQAYRFNQRHGNDSERFVRAFCNVANRRITYKELTAKEAA